MSKPGRNELCPCGSGLKYKFCHGDAIKQEIAKDAMNRCMATLIVEEMKNKGLIKRKYHCNGCGSDFDEPKQSQVANCQICPVCDSTNIKGIKKMARKIAEKKLDRVYHKTGIEYIDGKTDYVGITNLDILDYIN